MGYWRVSRRVARVACRPPMEEKVWVEWWRVIVRREAGVKFARAEAKEVAVRVMGRWWGREWRRRG